MVFFGREIGGADRRLLPTYQLKSRGYLGPTAMDAEMVFLMANQGLAQPGKLVYDPFVGTGSILVAAAHFGAMTMVCVLLNYMCVDSCLDNSYLYESIRVQISTYEWSVMVGDPTATSGVISNR